MRTPATQIADWLERLEMSEYAQRFAENRIDFSVLPDLTDQHLKDLGVALGDRLKMLRAIRELAGTAVSCGFRSGDVSCVAKPVSRRRLAFGAKRGSGRWSGRRWLKPSSSWGVR